MKGWKITLGCLAGFSFVLKVIQNSSGPKLKVKQQIVEKQSGRMQKY
jgi:hypothetical protein